jgi:3-dehydroquinate dehydratase-1
MKLGDVELVGAPRAAGVVAGGLRLCTVRKAISAGADLLELRVDTFAEADPSVLAKRIEGLKASVGKLPPLILTVRSEKEGGGRAIPDKTRAAIFKTLMPLIDAIDVELSSGRLLADAAADAMRHGKKVIASYHNFTSTPDARRLREIIRRGFLAGADMVKIAAMAKGPDDLKRLAGVLLENTGVIVIAMGEYGALSRVFFPMLGSLITYGSVNDRTAPGQMPLRTIKKEFRLYGF